MDITNIIGQNYDNIRPNDQEIPQIARDNSITNVKNLKVFVEKGQVEELINLLEKEKIQKASLNSSLNVAFANYRSNSDMIEIIDVLLTHGADVNHHIHYANKNNNQKIDEKDNVTILMYACLKGDLELIHTILSHHPEVNLKDKNNKNALLYAILADKGDNVDVVLTLIREGIDLNECGRLEHLSNNGIVVFYTHSPLTLATVKNMNNTVQLLIDNGANVNFKMVPDEDTALHIAVRNGNIDIVLSLLAVPSINLQLTNKDNKTPCALAHGQFQHEIYRILIERVNQNEAKEKVIVQDLLAESSSQAIRTKKKRHPEGHLESNVGYNEQYGGSVYHNYISRVNVKDSNTTYPYQMRQTSDILSPNYEKTNSNISNDLEFNSVDNYYSHPTQNLTSSEYTLESTKIQSHQINPVQINLSSSHASSVTNSPTKNSNVGNLLKNANAAHKKQQQKKIYNKYLKSQRSIDTYLEIPIEFREKNGDAPNLDSFLKMISPPILTLDLSNDLRINSSILSFQAEDLHFQVTEKSKQVKAYEDKMKHYIEENTKLKMELKGLNDSADKKEKSLNIIQNEFRMREEQLMIKLNDLQKKHEEKLAYSKQLLEHKEQMENELQERLKNSLELERLQNKELNRKELLEKKFFPVRYEDKYIIKCLQSDILDFQDFNKEQIRKNKSIIEELFKLVQVSVMECLPDFEVRLFGSHATNLCLSWSDLDMVLVHKRTQSSTNYAVLHTLYLHLLEKDWKKSIKFIDSAAIPLIKLTASDEFNSMQMDISLQDGKHYGLKCVELVKSFMQEYEALEPLIFSLKNLVKNANLNDPYTGGLSSYGLILMVTSYLQSQLESKKSISMADGNVGRLFLEFLCYYGLIFDHTKYVIYTYPPEDLNYVDKDNNSFFFNMQSGHELIIVDPLSKSNNVARSTYQFVNIKMAFMIGFVVSREECECGCHFNSIGDDSVITNSDHCILKRIFNSVKRFNAGVNNT